MSFVVTFIVIFVVVFLFILIGIIATEKAGKIGIDNEKQLEMVANTFNRECPRIGSSNAYYKSVTTIPGMIIVFNISVKKSDLRELTKDYLGHIRSVMLDDINKNFRLAILRNNNIDIWQNFSDEEGNLLFTLKFTSNEYIKS